MCTFPPPERVPAPGIVPVLHPFISIPVFCVSDPSIVYSPPPPPMTPFVVENDHLPLVDEDGTNSNDDKNGLLVLMVKGFSKSQISPEKTVSPAFPLALYG